MAKRVLILTQPGDGHAHAVAEALRHKGAEVVLWHTSDFPTCCGETILFEGRRRRVSIRGPEIDLIDPRVHTVWRRRPCFVIGEGKLHPADRRFASSECRGFRWSLFDLLSPGAFWVNRHAA